MSWKDAGIHFGEREEGHHLLGAVFGTKPTDISWSSSTIDICREDWLTIVMPTFICSDFDP